MHFAVSAQGYIISGKVSNAHTKEGIPFASVFIKGSGVKVATDFEGNYKLRLKHGSVTVGVSCIGFQKMFKKAGKAKQQVIDFELSTVDSTVYQQEILSRNRYQALDIVRKVIEHKSSHNKRKLNSYGYEAYTRIQMNLVDITEKFKNRKLFRPFKFVFNNIDSASENKPFLPFFISETVSDYYFQKKPLAGREIIKASKISGLDDINISQFMGTSFAETDIYSEYILILKREFLSPVSLAGVGSYNYYLEDSSIIDKIKCYRIRFVPRSSKLLRLEGQMWVADSVFAIKHISLHVGTNSNVNLINGISLDDEFVPIKDSVWILKKESLSINFARFNNTPELVLHKNAWYKNFIINASKQSVDSLFRDGRPDVSVNDSARQKSDGYWQEVRHSASVEGNGDGVYKMIDTLGSLKATRDYINLMQTVFIGFTDIGPISIGNLYSLVGENDIQGWHFKLALRTNSHLTKAVRFGGYIAYGLLDKKVRYGGEALWMIKKNPRISFYARYRYDLMPNPNASSFFTTPEFFTTYGLRRVEHGRFIPMKLMDNHELKLQFYHEFKFGYSYQVGFKNQRLKPLQDFNFSYHTADENLSPNTDINDINVTEFSLIQRFAWRERFVGNNFTRYSLGSKYPVLFFEYSFGAKRVLGGQFNYHKLAVGLSDTRLLGPLGKLRWNIEAGKIFGTLPFLILSSPDASETYISWWPGFNTISKYQFAADRYVKVMLDHHLGGLILDRIPGLNKLKLREVWSARMWWGDLTNSNYNANYANLADNVNNTGLVRVQTADKIPFVEMSAGLENILGFFRIDAVWRVTHLDPEGSRFSFKHGNFGVRMAFEVQF
ncbi:MAG: hypothetical protein JWO06_77 [Bacteroidota bacterium]|nr:hypothetical protein [Bacteroidota bacterium]